MIALDTNVLARFYLNDEPGQAQIAARLLMEEDVFIPKTVLLELEWVMPGAARVPPAGIARSMAHLLSLDNVRIEDEAVVRIDGLVVDAAGVRLAEAELGSLCQEAARALEPIVIPGLHGVAGGGAVDDHGGAGQSLLVLEGDAVSEGFELASDRKSVV